MNQTANSLRGEAMLTIGGQNKLLRPTFSALIAAEDELGPLLAMVERAANGQLKLGELSALFWHCLDDQETYSRHDVENAIIAIGLTRCADPLRAILAQILKGTQ